VIFFLLGCILGIHAFGFFWEGGVLADTLVNSTQFKSRLWGV